MNTGKYFAYSVRPTNQRISRVVTNPLTNSFNSVDAIVSNINISAKLPPLYDVVFEVEDIPFEQPMDERLLEVVYPDTPSFVPSAEDTSFFKMITEGMVTSMRESTETDFHSECCDPYYDYLVEHAVVSEEEKRICDLKLQRFDYEQKQSTSISDPIFPDQDPSNPYMDASSGSDRRYINDFVSSHFHDLLTPMKLSVPAGQTAIPITTSDNESMRQSPQPLTPSDSNECEKLMEPFLSVLNGTIDENRKIFAEPVQSKFSMTRSTLRTANGPVVNQLSTFYTKAKEMEKKQNSLPPKQNLIQNDSTHTLPHRRRASSSSSITSATSRSVSSSVDISSVQGELYSILKNVGNLDDGVNRIKEIDKVSGEMTKAQRTSRALREELNPETPSTIWRSVGDLFDLQQKQSQDTYNRMISQRMSYRPNERAFSLDQIAGDMDESDVISSSTTASEVIPVEPELASPSINLMSPSSLMRDMRSGVSMEVSKGVESLNPSKAVSTDPSRKPEPMKSTVKVNPSTDPILIERPRLRSTARPGVTDGSYAQSQAIPPIKIQPRTHSQRIPSESRASLQPPAVTQTRISIHPSSVTSNRDTIDSSLPVPSTPSNSGSPANRLNILPPKRSLIVANRNSRVMGEPRLTTSIRDSRLQRRLTASTFQSEMSEEGMPIRRVTSVTPVTAVTTDTDGQTSVNSLNSSYGIRGSTSSTMLSPNASFSRMRRSALLQPGANEVKKVEENRVLPDNDPSNGNRIFPESSQSDVSRVSNVIQENVDYPEEDDSDIDRDMGVLSRDRELSTAEILNEVFSDKLFEEMNNQLLFSIVC